jgi:hypothetical protein
MAVVTPLNNFLGPEGDTVTVDEQLLNTEYWVPPPGEAECRDRQISENDPKKGYLCAPALLSAQCLPHACTGAKGRPLPSPHTEPRTIETQVW